MRNQVTRDTPGVENPNPDSARRIFTPPPHPNTQHSFSESCEIKAGVSLLSPRQPQVSRKALPSSSPTPQTLSTLTNTGSVSGFGSTIHPQPSGVHSVNKVPNVIPLANVRLPTLALLKPPPGSSGIVEGASAGPTEDVKKTTYSKGPSRIGRIPYIEIPLVSRRGSSGERPSPFNNIHR